MSQSIEQERVLAEIRLIPEDKLPDVYQLLHYFRLGLEASRNQTSSIMRFAGCWRDLPDRIFDTFFEDIAERRHQAFLGRRAGEAGAD